MSGSLHFPDPPGVHHLDRDRLVLLLRQATEHRLGVTRIDLSAARDKSTVMARLAGGLHLPDTFGANLDALYDCLTDADLAPEGVLILEGLHDVVGLAREELLDVFADALDQRPRSRSALTVYWSA
ncbi:MAG: barstar family protein [Burkholderiaceae bacterium]